MKMRIKRAFLLTLLLCLVLAVLSSCGKNGKVLEGKFINPEDSSDYVVLKEGAVSIFNGTAEIHKGEKTISGFYFYTDETAAAGILFYDTQGNQMSGYIVSNDKDTLYSNDTSGKLTEYKRETLWDIVKNNWQLILGIVAVLTVIGLISEGMDKAKDIIDVLMKGNKNGGNKDE